MGGNLACAALAAMGMMACSAAGTDSQVVDVEEPNVAEAPIDAPVVQTAPAPEASVTGPIFPDVLYVTPDAELMPFMQAAIDRYAALGFNVAISEDGMPMNLSSDLPEGSQARAYYRHWCFFTGCSPASTYVKVSPALLDKPAPFVVNSLLHEMGHVISGWGGCEDRLPMADGMHLVKGNLISNGNVGYGAFVFTEDDLRLLNSCLTTK